MPSNVDGDDGVRGGLLARPVYRRHSREYKDRVVAEYDALPAGDARGSLLRRERLQRNQIWSWRNEAAGKGEVRVSKRVKRSADQVEIARLRKANAKLQAEVERTRLALEITGKAHALLELFSQSAASDNESSK